LTPLQALYRSEIKSLKNRFAVVIHEKAGMRQDARQVSLRRAYIALWVNNQSLIPGGQIVPKDGGFDLTSNVFLHLVICCRL
jgi:hypothetical protein